MGLHRNPILVKYPETASLNADESVVRVIVKHRNDLPSGTETMPKAKKEFDFADWLNRILKDPQVWDMKLAHEVGSRGRSLSLDERLVRLGAWMLEVDPANLYHHFLEAYVIDYCDDRGIEVFDYEDAIYSENIPMEEDLEYYVGSASFRCQSDEYLLSSIGFTGFATVEQLRCGQLRQVPNGPGVYAVVVPDGYVPDFQLSNPGGQIRGRDPTVSVETLKRNWVNTSRIIYFGKAGGYSTSRGLNTRIGELLKFGEGRRVAHRGGRYLWQLSESQDFLIGWLTLRGLEPRKFERSLLQLFVNLHGRLPFANLMH